MTPGTQIRAGSAVWIANRDTAHAAVHIEADHPEEAIEHIQKAIEALQQAATALRGF